MLGRRENNSTVSSAQSFLEDTLLAFGASQIEGPSQDGFRNRRNQHVEFSPHITPISTRWCFLKEQLQGKLNRSRTTNLIQRAEASTALIPSIQTAPQHLC